VHLTNDMKRVVLEQRLGFAATVCADGTPNLSPKGTTTVLDDEHLLFADIHSPGTVRNLERNTAIELNVVDPIVRKGYRFKGGASLHSEGETYEEGLRLLGERGYDASRERIKTIVVVEVERAAPLVSPVYDSGATEEQVAKVWERKVAQLRSGQHAGFEGRDARAVDKAIVD
jgi:predicted pyridoxine 5'-phosphate oxidase superfamily flavin-nucleotide-binding protein